MEECIMDNFAEAKEKATEMLEQTSEEKQIPPEQPEQPAEEQLSQEEVTARALEASQKAVEIAQKRSADVEALRTENEHLKGLLRETQESNQENIEGLSNEMPELDLSDLTFADDEQVAQRTTDYMRKAMEYAQRTAETNVLKKLEPIISKAQQSAELQEQAEVLSVLENVPSLSGIKEAAPQLKNIISTHKALQSPNLSTEEKMITAYAILQGVNGINSRNQKPTHDDFVSMYEQSPELQQLVEQKRAEKLKDSQQVPNLSPSSGAGNVALNIQEKPKNLKEAFKYAQKKYLN